jgi:prepilin-type N-terminal cleavage/methylation domain-containing protein
MKFSRGFSLIELMISSVLSLMLLAVIVKLYQNNQTIYKHQESMALIQENARVAVHMLHTGIQSAGYIGCARIDNIKIDSDSEQKVSPKKIIGVYKDSQILPGTDAIVIRHMNTQTVEFETVPRKGTKTLWLTADKGLKEGDEIVIADCIQMQTAKILQKSTNQLRIEPAIQYSFSKQAQIGRLIESRFYIADTERQNNRGKPIFSLYWEDISRTKLQSEMVEGVEKMNIRYGVLLSRGLVYQSGEQVRDWSKVRTVQISLLLTNSEQDLKREWNSQITLRGLL